MGNEWIPRLTSLDYDKHLRPASQKRGCLMGMAMTEKQGGSDVRANSTRAVRIHSSSGDGDEYELIGHKWYAAPASVAFPSSLPLLQPPLR